MVGPQSNPAIFEAPASSVGLPNSNGSVPAPVDLAEFPLTDYGNAERMVAMYGTNSRYVQAWGTWLCWDGKRWRRDDGGETYRRAKATIRAMTSQSVALFDKAASLASESPEASKKAQETADAMLSWARRSEASARLAAMIQLAESEAGIPVRPSMLDTDKFLFNVPNGTIDLKTGELRPHAQTDLMTKMSPVEYQPEAKAPTFERFLAEIFADDQELTQFVQRAIGYSLTGDVSEQCIFFLHGLGANGKSTLLNLFHYIMGDYGKTAAPELLLLKQNETHPTERADLFGARFVSSVEIEAGRQFAEVLLKTLTGGDPVKARYMRQDFWEFEPTHKVFVAANHKPTIRGTDYAIWRRIYLLPFDVTFTKEKQDPNLPERLKAEAEGVLAWAVQGCLQWREHKLGECEAVKGATKRYREEMDTLADFIGDNCDVGGELSCTASELFEAYQTWSQKTGERAMAKRAFGLRLGERGFIMSRGTRGARRWVGLKIAPKSDASDANIDTSDASDATFGYNRPRPRGDVGDIPKSTSLASLRFDFEKDASLGESAEKTRGDAGKVDITHPICDASDPCICGSENMLPAVDGEVCKTCGSLSRCPACGGCRNCWAETT